MRPAALDGERGEEGWPTLLIRESRAALGDQAGIHYRLRRATELPCSEKRVLRRKRPESRATELIRMQRRDRPRRCNHSR